MSFKVKDHFYKRAKQENYRARSVYKLEEINAKFNVLKRGDWVLDLGCCPGSWTQYAARVVGEKGRVVGVDLQTIDEQVSKLKNVTIHQMDIYQMCSLEDVGAVRRFDVVLSDMAPKTTGVKIVDQAKSLALLEQVIKMLPMFLREGGSMVAKVFEGQEAQEAVLGVQKLFDSSRRLRPRSTRSASKEFFVIGKGFCV